jgi:hypothetical protein
VLRASHAIGGCSGVDGGRRPGEQRAVTVTNRPFS